MMTINLEPLERHSIAFRADELYFIGLANAYIRGMFWDFFPRTKPKRRLVLYDITKNHLPLTGQENDPKKPVYDALIPPRTQTLDTISGTFTNNILKNFPEDLILAFENKNRLEYGFFLRFQKNYPDAETMRGVLETLARRRNTLQHFDKPTKKGKGKSDTEKFYSGRADSPLHNDLAFIKALSLFLLPDLLHHFAGRVSACETRLKKTGHLPKDAPSQADEIRAILRQAVKERRENTHQVFAEERTRQNNKDKSLRKKLVDPEVPWRKAYREMTRHKTDYREHEFKMRYHFIGQENIDHIRKFLRNIKESQTPLSWDSDTRPMHFKRDIEAFYLLTQKIHLVMHRLFHELPRDDKDEILGETPETTEILRKIRNAISHNRLFWKTEITFAEQMRLLLYTAYWSGGMERMNDFKVQIERLLLGEKYAVMDIKGLPPKTLHVTQWTKNQHQNKKNPDATTDMRRTVKRAIGKWMTSLNQEFEKITLEKRKKKDKMGRC